MKDASIVVLGMVKLSIMLHTPLIKYFTKKMLRLNYLINSFKSFNRRDCSSEIVHFNQRFLWICMARITTDYYHRSGVIVRVVYFRIFPKGVFRFKVVKKNKALIKCGTKAGKADQ